MPDSPPKVFLRICWMVGLVGLATASFAGQPAAPYLVHDLQTAPFNGRVLSYDKITVVFNDVFYYAADDGIRGVELWRSDGTAEGTRLVRDICPGWCSSAPERLTVAGDWLFFTADDGESGTEVWKSDGSDAGTIQVADIRQGPDSSEPYNLSALGDTLLFSAFTEEAGVETWRTDGTLHGTYPLGDLFPGEESSQPSQAVSLGSVAVFGARTSGSYTPRKLFRTDGTGPGTEVLFDFGSGSASWSWNSLRYTEWPVVDGVAYFSAQAGLLGSGQLWRTDGTPAGTFRVNQQPLARGPQYLQAFDSKVFFVGDNSGGQYQGSLWVSDGTSSGTAELIPTQGCSPRNLTGTDVGLFFICHSPSFGYEPWLSNGTASGTAMIRDLAPGSTNFDPWGEMQAIPDGVILSGRTGPQAPIESWFSNGTSTGTYLLPIPSANGKQRSGILNGSVLFWGRSHDQQTAYVTDGSIGGTSLIGPEHTQTSSYPSQFAVIDGSRSFFTTQTPSWSPYFPTIETWSLDTTTGARATLSPFLGGAETRPPFAGGAGRIFFSSRPQRPDPASGPTGKLISVDRDLADFRVVSSRPGSELREFGGQLYRGVPPHWSSGLELTMIDPLSEQIIPIPGPSLSPEYPGYGLNSWFDAGRRLFFPSLEGVWSIDTFGAPTDHLPGVEKSDAHAISRSGHIFFSAETPATGREVWSLEPESGKATLLEAGPGAESGVYRVDYYVGDNSPFVGVALGNLYFFTGDDGHDGPELWATTVDGPPYLVSDVIPGRLGSYPQALKVVGNRVLFRANDGVHGVELWTSDGTREGTFLLRDIRTGPRSSLPQELTVVDGLLVFTAFDDQHGRELWLSDGTRRGTQLVNDIAPGKDSSSPSWFLAQPGVLLFSANDTRRHGFEPWALDRPLAIDTGLVLRTGFEAGDTGAWSVATASGTSRLSNR